MPRNVRGSQGTRESTNSARFRFAGECACAQATKNIGSAYYRNNLRASHFDTTEVLVSSQRRDIGTIIAGWRGKERSWTRTCTVRLRI